MNDRAWVSCIYNVITIALKLLLDSVMMNSNVREAIGIKIGQPAMNRDQGYELPPPIYDELLLSCDRRQGYHMTSEGEALRPEEECAKHLKISH